VAPICLLATFIVLAPLGFSLNLLTLLALVLAVGLVVDDAIVVVENIQRRLDRGRAALVAAERGTRQVFFAVVATTIVLMSVFAPLLFLPGYVGRLFVELAAAIAAAVAFSAFLALSLSPMLASKILRPGAWRRLAGAPGRLGHGPAEDLLRPVAGHAAGAAHRRDRRRRPDRPDRGGGGGDIPGPAQRTGAGRGPGPGLGPRRRAGRRGLRLHPQDHDGAWSLCWPTTRPAARPIPIWCRRPASAAAVSTTGNGVLVLSDWSKRDRTAAEIAQELNGKLRGQTDAQVNASTPGAFQRGGGNSNSIELIATGTDYQQIYNWLKPMLAAAQANPGFSRPRLNYEPNSPRLLVDVDPHKAATLGVSAQSIGRTLETMFGSRKATTYIKGGQEYDVILQTERDNRRRASRTWKQLHVRTGGGAAGAAVGRGDDPDLGRHPGPSRVWIASARSP
jgi:multidrug efflux pump